MKVIYVPNTFLKQSNVSYFIESELKRDYTAEIISQKLKEKFGETVSHAPLPPFFYIYIYSSQKGLSRYLLRHLFERIPRNDKETAENIN